MSEKVVLRKTSLIDYPGCISAVIFFSGCNLRCPWCHNRELVLGAPVDTGVISLEEALRRIEKRRKVLGGVVLSGGEPTVFNGLDRLIVRIKALGLRVKLDTNGLRPHVLESLFGAEETRPDYIAMDLKTSPERYAGLMPGNDGANNVNTANNANTASPGEKLIRSAALLRSSGIAHEFRSIALPASPGSVGNETFFGESDKTALAILAGDSPWHIRPFVPGNCLDPAWDTETEHG